MTVGEENTLWEHPWEQALVREVFQRAYRNLLNKIESTAGRRGVNLHDKWCAEQAQLFRSFSSCKTQPLCRKTIVTLLAKAKVGDGDKPVLVHNPNDEHNAMAHLWRMLNHPRDCMRAIDLATYALVTFTDARLQTSNNPSRD